MTGSSGRTSRRRGGEQAVRSGGLAVVPHGAADDPLRAVLLARSAEAVLLSAFEVWRPEDEPALFARLSRGDSTS
ncbi:hypothetical protein [Cryptosporangium aurantiacum]|uniref:hypothetical protein n=1 Tax=Cryptosporangium aurantiacum TaxID=134849 RepID=UPI001160FB16|nr:hypothetical protein [Cryptosporangium aurantiacum]